MMVTPWGATTWTGIPGSGSLIVTLPARPPLHSMDPECAPSYSARLKSATQALTADGGCGGLPAAGALPTPAEASGNFLSAPAFGAIGNFAGGFETVTGGGVLGSLGSSVGPVSVGVGPVDPDVGSVGPVDPDVGSVGSGFGLDGGGCV